MSLERSRVLIGLARASIAEAFGGPKPTRPADADWLDAPGAVFVTLRRQGKLRGCVGSLSAQRSLFNEVVFRAKSAAFRDTRLTPVRQDELHELTIDISVLTPLEPLAAHSEEEAIALLQPGIDGVLLECPQGSAVFIPKMWKQLPDPRSFLAQLKKKAGLEGWPPQMTVSRFTAEEHSGAAMETS